MDPLTMVDQASASNVPEQTWQVRLLEHCCTIRLRTAPVDQCEPSIKLNVSPRTRLQLLGGDTLLVDGTRRGPWDTIDEYVFVEVEDKKGWLRGTHLGAYLDSKRAAAAWQEVRFCTSAEWYGAVWTVDPAQLGIHASLMQMESITPNMALKFKGEPMPGAQVQYFTLTTGPLHRRCHRGVRGEWTTWTNRSCHITLAYLPQVDDMGRGGLMTRLQGLRRVLDDWLRCRTCPETRPNEVLRVRSVPVYPDKYSEHCATIKDLAVDQMRSLESEGKLGYLPGVGSQDSEAALTEAKLAKLGFLHGRDTQRHEAAESDAKNLFPRHRDALLAVGVAKGLGALEGLPVDEVCDLVAYLVDWLTHSGAAYTFKVPGNIHPRVLGPDQWHISAEHDDGIWLLRSS
jgi:hypothetical protein